LELINNKKKGSTTYRDSEIGGEAEREKEHNEEVQFNRGCSLVCASFASLGSVVGIFGCAERKTKEAEKNVLTTITVRLELEPLPAWLLIQLDFLLLPGATRHSGSCTASLLTLPRSALRSSLSVDPSRNLLNPFRNPFGHRNA
jgi:hypothetical protein